MPKEGKSEKIREQVTRDDAINIAMQLGSKYGSASWKSCKQNGSTWTVVLVIPNVKPDKIPVVKVYGDGRPKFSWDDVEPQ